MIKKELAMVHLFKAEKEDGSFDAVWFDAEKFTEEEAEARFKPVVTTKQMYYQYDDEPYHEIYTSYQYIGCVEDNEVPGYPADMRFPNVDWYCDKCGAYLNVQDGFDDHKYIWKCKECGYKNSISKDNIR